MHEVALARGIVEVAVDAAQESHCRRVRRICVAVGALAPVEVSALSLGFAAASLGTPVEGADLLVHRPEGTGRCLACGAAVAVARRGDDCPACGGAPVLVTGGDELTVTALEVD